LIKVQISPDDKVTDDDMVIHMGEKTDAYKGLVKKPERKRLLQRPVPRMENYIERNPTELGWDKIHVA
jgi:hypothetical protein